jgi:3-oxoacyl-[acyl-carrier protein] reductase
MIVLTGSSGGIGGSIIESLSRLDDVIGVYNNTLPQEKKNIGISYKKLDLENSNEISDFSVEHKKILSNITLIHLAGIMCNGLAASYEEPDWDSVMNINVKGNFFLTKSLIPAMINDRFGRIIHISSIAGQSGETGTVAYSTSKAGLLGMSNVLAKEYGRFNITSNVLCLGHFRVGITDRLAEDKKKLIVDQIPSKKLGNVNNIVNAIEFIMKSDYVNGSVINIDGGI